MIQHLLLRARFTPDSASHRTHLRANWLLFDRSLQLCDDAFKSSKFGRRGYDCQDVRELLEYARQNGLCLFSDN